VAVSDGNPGHGRRAGIVARVLRSARVRRFAKIALWTFGALAVLVVAARPFVNDLLWSRIEKAIRGKYDVDVAVDDFALVLRAGEATIRGVRITDHGKPLIEAERVEMSASLWDVFGATYDFRELTVTGLAVHCVVETPTTTNVGRIWNARKTSPGPGDFVRFQKARIVGGQYFVEDSVTDPARPTLLHLENIDVEVRDLQAAGAPRTRDFGDVRLDCVVAQKAAAARLSAVGWFRPITADSTFALHAALTGLDLAEIPQYVDQSSRAWLGGDVMHLVGSMRAKDGVVREGAIVGEVAATGTLLPMNFGGPVFEPVFDERSKLADLFRFGFERLGRVAVIGDVGTAAYGVGKSIVEGTEETIDAMAHLDPFGALSAAGGGVTGGLKSVGEGFVGVGRRILDLAGVLPKDDPAKQEAEFEALHALRRSAMFEAALRSARRGPAARRTYLEKEIGASAPRDAAQDEGDRPKSQ